MNPKHKTLSFRKMHGLGNDFIIIDAINQSINSLELPIKQLANRHLGIGFDQLLIVETSTKADFSCRIFNADGSIAEQCGNGLRCVARFIHDTGLSSKKSLTLETKAGIFTAFIEDDQLIRIEMGQPCFQPDKIPFLADQTKKQYELIIQTAPYRLQISALSMGNPHAILQVPSIKDAPVLTLGAQIATHPAFPQGTNVGFMEIVNRQHIRLRTFERGVGETFACGSNACAAVVAGIQNGQLNQQAKTELAFGNLWITWEGEHHSVIMTGPTTSVFEGTFNL